MSSGLISVLVVVGAALAAMEAAAWSAVLIFRRNFPWLILPRDATPEIAPEVIEKYARLSFDADLGWVRKPGTLGLDASPEGDAAFLIADDGARTNPGFEDEASCIVVFGDSYAFCRLVDDTETWPHELSGLCQTNARNFGVGNYGLDQALLRYERQAADHEGCIVIMAVVPETITRVHSCWKHFYEYGNTLAFKPMFQADGSGLKLIPCAVREASEIGEPSRWSDVVCRHDRFYREKFLPDLIRFPASLSILRRWRRHGRILSELFCGVMTGEPEAAHRRAFSIVLDENHLHQRRLFAEPDALELLRRLVVRFEEVARRHGAMPRLVILPQPRDLADRASGIDVSREAVHKLGQVVPVLDLGDVLLQQQCAMEVYKGGALGPHTSPAANRLIAETVHQWLASDGLLQGKESI